MRQQNDRHAIVLHHRERGCDIVPAGPQVADARYPERAYRRIDLGGRILQDANTVSRERILHSIVVKPPVVVAQDRDNPRRCAKALQFRRDLFRSDEMSADDALDNKVAQDEDYVRVRRVRAVDDVVEFCDSVERRANMKVRQDANA
jgi:hypothetical protein